MGSAVQAIPITLPQGSPEAIPETNPFIDSEFTDPVIPQPPVPRTLTPFEQRRIREEADAARLEAEELFASGDVEGAFALWTREILLLQTLGPQTEIEALGRVGEIAWAEERQTEVLFITERLEYLEQDAIVAQELQGERLDAFAIAYEQVHALPEATDLREQQLAIARSTGDQAEALRVLAILGPLYRAQFNYLRAAQVYEELLAAARATGDFYSAGIFLKELAEIYTKAAEPENSLAIRQELANYYFETQQYRLIPALSLEIGDDYLALEQPEQASQLYQRAFKEAWAVEQFSIAGDALNKLGDLYRSYQQPQFAIQVYGELLKIYQQSYNLYGLMKTYEKIGDIQVEQGNLGSAQNSYTQALELAFRLDHQTEYYEERLNAIAQ